MSWIRQSALFMMFLLVFIPIVHAQELSLMRFGGRESAQGFTKTNDDLSVEVNVNLPKEQNIDREQVRFFVEDSYAFFDNCTKIGNSSIFRCIFVQPEFEAYEPFDFSVKLFDDDGKQVLERSEKIKPDNIPPRLSAFNVTPAVTKGEVDISYSGEDYGLNYETLSDCSGIKSIDITQGNNTLVSEIGKLGLCHKEDSFTRTLTESGKVCMSLTDFTNQKSDPSCIDVRVDKLPPSIESASLSSSSGFELTHIKNGEEVLATVTAVITDDGSVDQGSVVGSFGSISKTMAEPVSPEIVNGDTYIWRNIPVNDVSNCKFGISAKDSLGSSSTKEFSCDVRPDNAAPVIKDIEVSKRRGESPLFGYGSSLVVEIEDKDDKGSSGIGVGQRNVYADLSSLKMDGAKRADECLKDKDSWKCSWLLNPPNSTAEGEYKIKIAASDDLENSGSEKEFELLYDGTPPQAPVLLNVSVLSGEAARRVTRGALENDFVQFYVRSKGFTTTSVDFTNIGDNPDRQATHCVGARNETSNCLEEECDCMFEGQVLLSGPYDTELFFVFTDDAGNSAQANASLEIFGLDNQTKPKYWRSEVTCSPELVDRSTASKINPYVSCRVHLESKVQNVFPLSIKGPESPDDCKGDVQGKVNDVYVTNNAEESKDPYLIFKLEARNYYTNQLNFTCPISIISKRKSMVGGKERTFITPVAQTLNAAMSVKFYNEPLKDMYSNVDDEIEDAIEDGLANQKWLGDIRKFMHYGEVICQIKSMITGVITALYAVTVAIGFAAHATEATPIIGPIVSTSLEGVKAAVCGTEETSAEGYKAIFVVIDLICSLLNCNVTQGGGGKKSGGCPQQGTGQAQKPADAAKPTVRQTPPAPAPAPAAGAPPAPDGNGASETLEWNEKYIAFQPSSSDSLFTGRAVSSITGAAADCPPAGGTAPSADSGKGASGGQQGKGESSAVGNAQSGKGAWGVVGAIGGGVPWCQSVQELLSLPSFSAGSISASELAGIQPLNIKDSLVWSAICLCIPGLVYNLEKLRQINCYKAVCLYDQVKSEGYPVSYCEEMYGYMLCQFVVGQIFAILPFMQFFEKLVDIVTTIVSDPFAAFTMALGAVCIGACKVKVPIGVYIFCAILKTISTIGEAVASVTQMTKTKGYFSTPPGGQYCKRMDRIQKEMKENKQERQQKSSGSSNTTSSAPGEGS